MRVGLIGYGEWGQNVARNIARVAELSVIAEPKVGGRIWEPWGAELSVIAEPKVGGRIWEPWGTRIVDYANGEFWDLCDAVWVATPAATHYEIVSVALDAGKHVLCEKPFVLNAAEARELSELAEKKDRVLMVGHTALYTAQHEAALRVVDPTAIRAVRRTVRPSLSDHNALFGLAPHDIACVQHIMGGPPIGIVAEGTKHRVKAELEFPGSRMATIEVDWLALERHREFHVNNLGFAGRPDPVEPLFREADAFVNLCLGAPGVKAKRDEAVAVTETLVEIEGECAVFASELERLAA